MDRYHYVFRTLCERFPNQKDRKNYDFWDHLFKIQQIDQNNYFLGHHIDDYVNTLNR